MKMISYYASDYDEEKQRILDELYQKEKDRELFRTRDGMSERQLKRIANRKPRKKIKKL